MKYLYITAFVLAYLITSTMDYEDQVAYYASHDQQGYKQAFYNQGNDLVTPCHTDSECESLNPHIKGQ